MKPMTSAEYSLTNPAAIKGFIVDTSTTRGTLDVTSLAGSFVRFQAITQDCDISFVDAVTAPAVDPLITVTAVGTLNVGQRIVTGQNEALVIPVPKSGRMWLVHKALGTGTLRGLEA